MSQWRSWWWLSRWQQQQQFLWTEWRWWLQQQRCVHVASEEKAPAVLLNASHGRIRLSIIIIINGNSCDNRGPLLTLPSGSLVIRITLLLIVLC